MKAARRIKKKRESSQIGNQSSLWRCSKSEDGVPARYLAEGVRAVRQLLQHRGLLSQVVVGETQIDVVTHHGDAQLIVKPTDTRREKKKKQQLLDLL